MQLFLSACEVFLEDGFVYAILAMGYYLTYSILDFPDLSVEGTVVTGAASFALLSRTGVNPWLALVIAFVIGCLCGSVTGILHVKLKIRPLLCGILVSTALISVNLIVTVVGMGGNFKGSGGLTTISLSRQDPTVFRTIPFNLIPENVGGVNLRKVLVFFIIAIIFKILLDLFLKTKTGLLLRATGSNEQYVTMLAKDPGTSKILGLSLGNGFAAVTGALLCQTRGNANQSMGLGMIVIGIASLIIGISIFSRLRFMKPSTKVLIGAVIYQACLSIATFLGVPNSYNKLIMALLFTVALISSDFLKKRKGGSLYD